MGRPDKSEERKKEILQAFFEVISEHGLEGASIAKIGRKMECPPSLILHYFKSKEEMLIEFVDMFFTRTLEHRLQTLGAIKNPRKRFEALSEDNMLEESGYTWEKISIVTLSIMSLGLRNPEVRERLRQMHQTQKSFLVGQLKLAAEAGVIHKKDIQRIADLVIIFNFGDHMLGPLTIETELNSIKKHYRETVMAFIIK